MTRTLLCSTDSFREFHVDQEAQLPEALTVEDIYLCDCLGSLPWLRSPTASRLVWSIYGHKVDSGFILPSFATPNITVFNTLLNLLYLCPNCADLPTALIPVLITTQREHTLRDLSQR